MPEPIIYSDAFPAMGTTCDVVLPNVEEEFARQVFQRVKSEVLKLEELLDGSIPHSPLAVLNGAKCNEWIEVPDELWQYLCLCYDFYQISSGAFDITIAPLVALWRGTEKPSEKEVGNAQRNCGFDKIEMDYEHQKIKFQQKGTQFDFGAIQKGFALDAIKPILLDLGIESAIVSFAEEVVLALGSHSNGELWPLGIRNQKNPMEFVHVFEIENQVLTSVVVNDWMTDGVVKNYTISPETGYPISQEKTVSVTSQSAAIGGFIARSWLILPENDKAILAENMENLEILEVDYWDDNVKTRLSILSKEE